MDPEGLPICLKHSGYLYKSFGRVKPGHCRWGDACKYSHNAPSAETSVLLKQLHEEKKRQLEEEARAVAEAEVAKLSAPLPPWLHETRKHCVFRSDSTDAFERMKSSLQKLLSLAVTDQPRKKTIVSEPGLLGLQLDELHLCPALCPERVPVVPTLAHAFRLSGRPFPKRWTMAYKQTKSMLRLMNRTGEYQAFLAAFNDFVKDVIAPLSGFELGGGIRFQYPPTLRVHMPGRAPTIGLHSDSEYDNHEPGEINFWVPFTRVFASNTLWCESSPGACDFSPFELSEGQAVRFNGNKCRHYTMPNETCKTRVSIDFRVIPSSVAVRPQSYLDRIGDYGSKEILVGEDWS